MAGLRAWWVARCVARRVLDDRLAAVDVVLGSRLDTADRGMVAAR